MADAPLRSLSADAAPPADPAGLPLVVDARRLAEMLCVSTRTVRTWDAGGRLPSPLRIGRRVVWRFAEVLAWIDSGAPCRQVWEARRASRK
jgi:predicted DNA-binding transcriptional regulator AlpA